MALKYCHEKYHHGGTNMMAEPRWWKYVILEDVNGVGVVKGFEEGTSQEIIDEYHEYQRVMREAHEQGIRL